MKRIILTSVLLIIFMTLTSCSAPQTQPTRVSTGSPQANMPNPASVYCEEQGNRLEIRTAADGSQNGVCIFPDGSECDEWAYFRGECNPISMEPTSIAPEVDSDGWKIHRNEILGYSFHYPPDAAITTNDDPFKSLFISGPGMGDEGWVISHPGDRDEYRPPEGVDLVQWLTDHYLMGEKRMPDTQIAGTLAVHFRHERSPQSPADDRYYFARAGQLFRVLIGHANNDIEDWDLHNRFLQSIQFDGNTPNASAPTAISTALPISVSDYQGWWTYTHPVYNFSIMLPEDWAVDETTVSDPLMNGHMLRLHPRLQGEGAESLLIRMTFRRTGEDVLLWPTGVGAGQFIQQGTLEVFGQPARRVLFVCPTGQINEIWYHDLTESEPDLQRGDLEFGFILTLTGFYCEAGHSLGGKVQRVGEMIIASLKVP